MISHREVETMLTVSDVARILNVHINTVRRWSNQRMLKSYRLGSRGDRRFRREDITNFLSGGGKDGDRRRERNREEKNSPLTGKALKSDNKLLANQKV